MGTRGLYGFRTKGEDYLTFSPSDSYPDGLGQFWFDTCKSIKSKGLTKDLAEKLSNTNNFVIEEGKYNELVGKLAEHLNVTKQSAEEYIHRYENFLKEDEFSVFNEIIQGNMNVFLNDKEFKKNGLFCEWCYIYDLDKDMFLISGRHSADLDLTLKDWQEFLKMV